jgi:hypothetical protein
MEDTVIINALKEEASRPNHKSPVKPIEDVNRKIDALTLEVSSLKREIRIIIDTLKPQTEVATQKGWLW